MLKDINIFIIFNISKEIFFMMIIHINDIESLKFGLFGQLKVGYDTNWKILFQSVKSLINLTH